jgi:hypothetical protein
MNKIKLKNDLDENQINLWILCLKKSIYLHKKFKIKPLFILSFNALNIFISFFYISLKTSSNFSEISFK